MGSASFAASSTRRLLLFACDFCSVTVAPIAQLACRRAGIVGLHCHDLRREGASLLLESRMSEHVKGVLGHANISITSTYVATTRQGPHGQMKQGEAHRTHRP